MARFVLTQHAIDRFRQRVAPQLTDADATAYLIQAMRSAVRLKTKTWGGQQLWQVPGEHPVVLVTKPDLDGQVAVTALPDGADPAIPEEERAIIEEWLAEKRFEEEGKRLAEAQREEEAARARALKDAEMQFAHVQARAAKEAAATAGRRTREVRREVHQATVRLAKFRQIEKTVRHQDKMALDAATAKRALKLALRYVVARAGEDPEAQAVLEAVRAVHAGFLGDGFLTTPQ